MTRPPALWSIEDLRARARAVLPREPALGALDPAFGAGAGDHALDAHVPAAHAVATARPAAVLTPIVARPGGATVLLTLRAADMRSHSGQIAFPGGKIDPGEAPAAAALREAQEEIGLSGRFIEPVGWLDPYLTGTGYRILPLVAIVDPAFTLTLNAGEVAEAFETPLSFLMDAANHQRHRREWQGLVRRFYAMPYQQRYIWGATAGILRNLWERLYS